MSQLVPMLFTPVYKDYIWGGDRIITKFSRDEEPGIYAESWEVSDREDGMSVVENGPLAGKTFAEALKEDGERILGSRSPSHDRFPLLIKLIDSRQDLSVQVHPNDNNKHRTGGEAKTEMWYILDAEPGACVYSGFTGEMDPETFFKRVESGDIEKQLQAVPVAAGDAVFTPGGRVHAIGAGCLILEVQQNSNTTYRIYDWGRVGHDGSPRPLHLKEAAEVIEWSDKTASMVEQQVVLEQPGLNVKNVLSTDYFVLEEAEVSEQWPVSHNGGSCRILFSPDVPMRIEWEGNSVDVPMGRSCLVPAVIQEFQIRTPEFGHVLSASLP